MEAHGWTTEEIAEAEERYHLEQWKMDRMYSLVAILRAMRRELWLACPFCDCVMLRQDLQNCDAGCMHIQSLLMSDLN